MAQYSKLWIALGGLLILLLLPIASKQLGVDFSTQTQIVLQVVISALTGFGVYQVPNRPAEPTKPEGQ